VIAVAIAARPDLDTDHDAFLRITWVFAGEPYGLFLFTPDVLPSYPMRIGWYSFTLHDLKGKRLIGFDNAHGVRALGGKKRRKEPAVDHWHRTARDKGRPYVFKDAERVVDDFFAEVERVLSEHGVPFDVVGVDDEGASL
jgi:hypothetical protein